MSFQKRWLPILLAGLFVVAMVGASVLTGSPEVLFPEMTAILCGAWIQPKQAWNVNRPRMLALMTTGAVFGLVMNLAFPGIPLPLRAVIGYAFCALCMNVAGADMTPMLSAAILPMLLGTDSWAYPVSVFVLVALVEAGQVALEHVGLREPIEYHPFRLPTKQALASWARRLGVFALFAVPAYATGNLFLAVPPLLVAYTELTRPDFTLRLRPWRAWAVLALAGVIGTLARDAVALLGMPSPLVAAFAFAALVVAWNGLRTWMPPWSSPWLYAAEVALGAAVWVAAALVLFPGIRPTFADKDEDPIADAPKESARA